MSDPLAQGVAEAIRTDLYDLRFAPGEQTPEAVAGAAVARMLELADAALLLETEGHAASAAILTRTAFEAHQVGSYALLGGSAACEALESDNRSQIGRFVAPNEALLAAMRIDVPSPDPDESATAPLGVWMLTQRVDGLLAERGEPALTVHWYNLLFRGESTISVHGLAPVLLHLDQTTDPWRLRQRSERGRMSFTTIVFMTAHLAIRLFRECSIAADQLAEKFAQLAIALFEPLGDVVEAALSVLPPDVAEAYAYLQNYAEPDSLND